MNITTAKNRLRSPDIVLESEYRTIHDALLDVLDSLDPEDTADVTTPLVETLLSLRASIRVIARDLGLMGTIVNVEDEQFEAAGYVVSVESA